jgi:hypothetical protein
MVNIRDPGQDSWFNTKAVANECCAKRALSPQKLGYNNKKKFFLV